MGEGLKPSARALLWAVAWTALPRFLLMPFNESFYGDAAARTELAQRWLSSPHWIASASQGAEQFGPLHVYGVASMLCLGIPAVDAGRWLSLLCGVASAVPLYLFGQRLVGHRAAWAAVLLFAFWGFHQQLSTTGGSEALGLVLTLSSAATLVGAIDEGSAVSSADLRWGRLVTSGLFATLASAVRYDLWLLLPSMALLCLWRRGFGAAAVWALAASLFPVSWLLGNAWVDGTPWAPMRQVESFHHAWVDSELTRYLALWGPAGDSVYSGVQLLFWPGIAFVTLGPIAAVAMGRGLRRAWTKRPRSRGWELIAAAPVCYFTVRAVVLRDFVPLARFTIVHLTLALPFAGDLLRNRSARNWAVTGAAAMTVALGAFTAYSQRVGVTAGLDRIASALRPVSPVSLNPSGVKEAATFLSTEAKHDGAILDADPAYLDLQLALLSGRDDLEPIRPTLEGHDPFSGGAFFIIRLPDGALGRTTGQEDGKGSLCLLNDCYRPYRRFRDGLVAYALEQAP